MIQSPPPTNAQILQARLATVMANAGRLRAVSDAKAAKDLTTLELIRNSSTAGLTGLIQVSSAAGVATITIPDHERRYGDKTVAVTGGVVEGRSDAVEEVLSLISYDDPARLGGAVAYLVTEDPDLAYQRSPEFPFRHYVAGILAPVDGGATTGGGGSSPPGSGYEPDPTDPDRHVP